MKKVCFELFEETRYNALLTIEKLCEELSITERTYFRWKEKKKAPRWAYKSVLRCTGDLSIFGWKGWRIENGTLYYNQVNDKYHHWTQKDLIVPLFTPPPIIDGKPRLRIIDGGRVNGVNRKEQSQKIEIDKTGV